MLEEIYQSAAQLTDRVKEYRHTLHQIPEVGLELPQTLAYVSDCLMKLGLSPQKVGPCGLTVNLGQGEKTILLRADMDALGVPEETNLPFRSTNGCMHACGHDMHTAILLGAAQVLKEHEDKLKCRVKLMFQPGEELGTGAVSMIEDGVLENPHVDAAAALHVDPLLPVGECAYCTGVSTSSIYDLFIHIKGKGGHSSTPEETVNALAVGSAIYQELSGLVQREVSGFDTAVLAMCAIKAGSLPQPNIIPETCEMSGTLRCYNGEVQERLHKRIAEIVEGVGRQYHAEARLESLLTPFLTVDPTLARQLEPALKAAFGADHVRHNNKPLAGSEDFGYVSQHVPTFFFWLGAGGPDRAPFHNPAFLADDEAMVQGLNAMVGIPLYWADYNA